MNIRFTSVLNPEKWGFEFCGSATDHWDRCYRTSNLFSYHALMFDTLGDGTTQHTPLYPVTSPEAAADWMVSLAHELIERPARYDYEFGHIFEGLPKDLCQFLASLKGPSQGYYSVTERKTSKSDSKRFDKRWQVIPEEPFTINYTPERVLALYQRSSSRQYTRSESLGLILSIGEHTTDYGFNLAAASASNQERFTEDEVQCAVVLRRVLAALHDAEFAKRNVDCVIGNHLRAKATATQNEVAA